MIKRLSPIQRNNYTKSRRVGYKPANSQKSFVNFLIICEGTRTEPLYFKSFESKYRNINIKCGGEAANTLSLVKEAVEIQRTLKNQYEEKFDHVWIVFDKDSFPDTNFDNAINKAEKEKFQCAWSNEAFELWYLLHFEFRHTSMSRSEYENKISGYIGKKYYKSDPKIYSLIEQNTAIAIDHAKKLEAINRGKSYHECNPGTTVHKLVEAIINAGTMR